MLESIALFESVVNSRWFLQTSIMLFLNKVDLFKTKVARVPLENYFPDYGGKVYLITYKYYIFLTFQL